MKLKKLVTYIQDITKNEIDVNHIRYMTNKYNGYTDRNSGEFHFKPVPIEKEMGYTSDMKWFPRIFFDKSKMLVKLDTNL